MGHGRNARRLSRREKRDLNILAKQKLGPILREYSRENNPYRTLYVAVYCSADARDALKERGLKIDVVDDLVVRGTLSMRELRGIATIPEVVRIEQSRAPCPHDNDCCPTSGDPHEKQIQVETVTERDHPLIPR